MGRKRSKVGRNLGQGDPIDEVDGPKVGAPFLFETTARITQGWPTPDPLLIKMGSSATRHENEQIA